MKKLISAIAVLTALGVSSAAFAAGNPINIKIAQSRNFENSEITAANPRTITVSGEVPEIAEFIAYINAAENGYRVMRTETE